MSSLREIDLSDLFGWHFYRIEEKQLFAILVADPELASIWCQSGSVGAVRNRGRSGCHAMDRTTLMTVDDVESDLQRNWDSTRGNSKLAWNEAKGAVRDGWHYVERALPGDADGDGR